MATALPEKKPAVSREIENLNVNVNLLLNTITTIFGPYYFS